MAATDSGTEVAILRLLEDLVAACGFPEWGSWGTEGATGQGVEGSPGARLQAGTPWNMAEVPRYSGFGEMTHVLAHYTLGCLQYYGELGINIAI
jgi:hypothetical protein